MSPHLLKVFLAFLLVLMLVPFIPSGEAVENGWGVTVAPNFAFNGDTVEIKVTGIPTQYAFVRVQLNNMTVSDGLIVLNEMGTGSMNYTLPMLAETGTYVIVVVNNGVNVTSTTLSVVFDDVTYLRFLLSQVQEEQDRQSTSLALIGQLAQGVKDRLDWIFYAALIGAVLGSWGWFLMHYKFQPWNDWKLMTENRKAGWRTKLQTTFYMIRNPPAEGLMTLTLPEMNKKIEQAKQMIKAEHGGRIPKETELWIEDKESAEGFRRIRCRQPVEEVEDVPEEAPERTRYEALDEPEEEDEYIPHRPKQKRRESWFSRFRANLRESRRQKKIEKENEAHERRLAKINGRPTPNYEDEDEERYEPPKKRPAPKRAPVATRERAPAQRRAPAKPRNRPARKATPAPVIEEVEG